jgi:uncharacterized repeat protein (TIGR01451 family)
VTKSVVLGLALASLAFGACSTSGHALTAETPSTTAASIATTRPGVQPPGTVTSANDCAVTTESGLDRYMHGPLRIELDSSPNPVAPGQSLRYTITVTNAGSVALTCTIARFALPAFVEWSTWSPTCEGAGPVFWCRFANSLAPGATQSAFMNTVVVKTPTPSIAATVTAAAGSKSGQFSATATTTTTES